MAPQLETLLTNARRWVYENRRILFWFAVFVFSILIMVQVQELASLLIFSYALALLIEPVVQRLQQKRIPRGGAILLVGTGFVATLALIALIIVPPFSAQFAQLAQQLPGSLELLANKVTGYVESWGFQVPDQFRITPERIRTFVQAIGVEKLSQAGTAVLDAVLKGYSLTLVLLNIALVPFFVFYISADLHRIHSGILSTLEPKTAAWITDVSREILDAVYLFFRGQMTIAAILAVMYAIGLVIVGVPSGFAIGILSGLLNIIPYFGLAIGLVLATLLSLVSGAGFGALLLAWGVFAAVQFVEGNFLTPKILGESMGIHPLIVMIALIIGGTLFGLLGIILAIPGAAALKVLFVHLKAEVDTADKKPARAG